MDRTIDKLITFLTTYRGLVDLQITAVFLEDGFSRLPSEWYSDLMQFSDKQLLNIAALLPQLTCPSLITFITEGLTLQIQCQDFTDSFNIGQYESYKMNPKKIHEVARLAKQVKLLADKLAVNSIVDVGAGQGYLSHLLVTQCNLSVTAIEAREHNAHIAKKRADRIDHLLKQHSGTSFKVKSLWVTPESLNEVIKEPSIIVGLHTCGDLAATCIKSFVQNEHIKGIVNVGCCYNHITEYICPEATEAAWKYKEALGSGQFGESLDKTIFSQEELAGYPLSGYIKANHPGFFLGRMPRILAMSEVHQLDCVDPEKIFMRFTYRNGFQCLLGRAYPEKRNVYAIRKRIKHVGSFIEYVRQGFQCMQLEDPYSDEEIRLIYDNEFRQKEKAAAVIWALRSVLCKVIENLLLLDRVMYLKENNFEGELVYIFDEGISPRNVALIGYKSS